MSWFSLFYLQEYWFYNHWQNIERVNIGKGTNKLTHKKQKEAYAKGIPIP